MKKLDYHSGIKKHLKRRKAKKPTPIKRRLLTRKIIVQGVIIWLVLCAGVSALVIQHIHNTAKQSPDTLSTAKSQTTTPAPSQPMQPVTASSIVTLLNQQRTAKGLTAFKWITQLNNAAVARANYMVANNTTSTTFGDPAADITTANYSYSNAEWSDTFNETTTQGVITSLTTGADSNFGFSTAYSDIGVGIVPDTISGNPTQLMFVYLANQATGSAPVDTYVPPPIDTTYVPPVTTYISPTYSAPTCNTSSEASYENSYESQYQELLEQESEEIQSLREQMAAVGAGDSSAYDAVPSEVSQEFSSKFAAIKSTEDSELASIDCSSN
jgi:hypothetical protein